jgi:hypothetical protein
VGTYNGALLEGYVAIYCRRRARDVVRDCELAETVECEIKLSMELLRYRAKGHLESADVSKLISSTAAGLATMEEVPNNSEVQSLALFLSYDELPSL